MNLNICSGPFPLRGYVNADMTPYPGTDVVCDARALPFKPHSFGKVFFCHAIEHFTYDEAMQILRDIKKTLKPGGTVVIEGPDVVKSVVNCKDAAKSMQYIFGDINQIRKHPLYAHKWGYTGELLAREMVRMGYKITKVTEGRSHDRPERDYRTEGANYE